jgi:hypothetical protein
LVGKKSSRDGPMPFWTWDWRRASGPTRVYLVYRLIVRPLLAIAAIVGATLVIVDAYPRARDTLAWREAEYRKLNAIHAGYDADFVELLLGVPTQSQAIPGTEYRESIYVRREHFVQSVEDGSGRIVLMTVTSCSPKFQPYFTIFDGLDVRLQDRPLEDTIDNAVGGPLTAEERQLGYEPGGTGSSPTMFWESTGPSSTASRGRTWFFGVNPLCISDAQRAQTPSERFFGGAADAPESAQAFRKRFAANTYGEVVDLLPAISDLGMIYLPPAGVWDSECADLDAEGDFSCGRVTLGTFWYETAVPPSGSTRTFG